MIQFSTFYRRFFLRRQLGVTHGERLLRSTGTSQHKIIPRSGISTFFKEQHTTPKHKPRVYETLNSKAYVIQAIKEPNFIQAPGRHDLSVLRSDFSSRPLTVQQNDFDFIPTQNHLLNSNLYHLMSVMNVDSYEKLYEMSIDSSQSSRIWAHVIDYFSLGFKHPPEGISKTHKTGKVEWLPGAKLNIVDWVFDSKPKDQVAIIEANELNSNLKKITYGELHAFVRNVAFQLSSRYKPGTVIGLTGSLNVTNVIAHLAIIYSGLICLPIPDSFSGEEIQSRLIYGNAAGLIIESSFVRSGKTYDMYKKLLDVDLVQPMFVYGQLNGDMRESDFCFDDFLNFQADHAYESVGLSNNDLMMILCSSGTTGAPKMFPWHHTNGLKIILDSAYTIGIKPDDTVSMFTNMGWMMGAWTVFSTLICGARLMLYQGTPTKQPYLDAIQNTEVTVLGIIPSIVKKWHSQGLLATEQWPTAIRTYFSTGERSNVTDYQMLARVSGNVPIIEYLGGTELTGGYIVGCERDRMNVSRFYRFSLGTKVVVLNDHGKQVKPGEIGEAFLYPGALGQSTELLNEN